MTGLRSLAAITAKFLPSYFVSKETIFTNSGHCIKQLLCWITKQLFQLFKVKGPISYVILIIGAMMAQLLEALTTDPRVLGSSP